jgi:iron(III) transport system permease protein
VLTAVRQKFSWDQVFLVLCFSVLGATVLYPTARLILEAFSVWDVNALREGDGWEAILNTLVICFGSVLLAGIFGTALAFLLTRYRFPGRNTLAALAYLPFTLPPLVGVLAFYYMIGRDGYLTRFLEQVLGLENAVLPGPGAILLIHAYSFYVFFYAMVSSALTTLDRSTVEAARTLGAGPVRTFFQVTIPQLRPALVGASLLTFMSSGASFSAPYFFGRDYPVLSVAIYNARSQFDNDTAVTLTVVLAFVALAGVIVFRSNRHAAASGSKGAPTPIRNAAGRVAASGTAWTLILLLLLPHFTILWFAFTSYREWHTALLPTTFTLENFSQVFSNAGTLAPIRNSLWMSIVATLATLLLAVPGGYLIARRRWGAPLLNIVVMIPWALPGTVIAINLIVAFSQSPLAAYGMTWLLPLAYFVRNVPLLTRMATAAMEPFDATLIEAGRTLGASPAYCFFRVVLPLVAPAIVAGMALVFATCLGEFVASILLYTPSNLPISVQINMAWRSDVGSAFAYSVFLMALVALTFVISRRFSARVL